MHVHAWDFQVVSYIPETLTFCRRGLHRQAGCHCSPWALCEHCRMLLKELFPLGKFTVEEGIKLRDLDLCQP